MQPTKEKLIITGYQWAEDMSYSGIYEFHNNEDKEEIHMPPRTTLKAPPITMIAGVEAYWIEATQEWGQRAEDLSWMDTEGRMKILEQHAKLAAEQGAKNGT